MFVLSLYVRLRSQSENKQLADEQEKLEKRTEDGETVLTYTHTHPLTHPPSHYVDTKGVGICVEQACSIIFH